jgi:hypothetical protein
MNSSQHLNALKLSRAAITQIRVNSDLSQTVSVHDRRGDSHRKEGLLHTRKTADRRFQLVSEFEIYFCQCLSFAGIPQPSTQYRTTSSTQPSISPEKGE